MSLCDHPSPTPKNLLGSRRAKHVHLSGRAWCSKASALAVSKGYHSGGSRSAPNKVGQQEPSSVLIPWGPVEADFW